MLHRGDDHVLDDTVEAVRIEVERLDFVVKVLQQLSIHFKICVDICKSAFFHDTSYFTSI